jgi:hypothetical protein
MTRAARCEGIEYKGIEYKGNTMFEAVLFLKP